MRKTTAFGVIICIIASMLISCNPTISQNNAENSTGTETETPSNKEEYTQQELDIIQISNNELTQKFGITDFSVFKITVNQFGTGEISVSYSVLLEGIFTEEQYFVNLDDDLNIIGSRASNAGKYSKYLKDSNFKTALYAAKAKIDEKAASYNETPHYYFMEKDGYLCLCTELIVNIDPPNYEIDDDGTVIEGGCGIDHDHIFFTEPICPIQ